MGQNAFFTIDKGNVANTGACVPEPGIIGNISGVIAQLPDIYSFLIAGAHDNRKLIGLAL
jgi:hypothetical protein